MEIWKTVEGFTNKYEISSAGVLRNALTGRIYKATYNRDGYKWLNIRYKMEAKYTSIHRLVALAFIPNPNNYPDVNHIDCNKENNTVENLEWCSHKHNMQHAVAHGLIVRPKGDGHYFNKPVIDNNTGIVYPSITKACEQLHICRTTVERRIKKPSKKLSFNFYKTPKPAA